MRILCMCVKVVVCMSVCVYVPRQHGWYRLPSVGMNGVPPLSPAWCLHGCCCEWHSFPHMHPLSTRPTHAPIHKIYMCVYMCEMKKNFIATHTHTSHPHHQCQRGTTTPGVDEGPCECVNSRADNRITATASGWRQWFGRWRCWSPPMEVRCHGGQPRETPGSSRWHCAPGSGKGQRHERD